MENLMLLNNIFNHYYNKKSGNDNTNPQNYRPISLLSTISEIFEKIIHIRLITYTKSIVTIPYHQF